jgi:hypothetical protein
VPDTDLDALFARLQAEAAVDGLLAAESEAALVELLRATLEALRREVELPAGQQMILETDIAGLHARLRLIDHGEAGRDRHFCFCALPQSNARAVQGRLRAAMTTAGIERAQPFRTLIILRFTPWPSGAVTQKLASTLTGLGGRVLAPAAEELRCFVALRAMMELRVAGFDDWLRLRRPIAGSAFWQSVGVFAALRPTVAAPAAIIPAPGAIGMDTDADLPLGQRPGDGAAVAPARRCSCGV